MMYQRQISFIAQLQETSNRKSFIETSWQVFSFFNLPPSSEELGDDVVHGPWVPLLF